MHNPQFPFFTEKEFKKQLVNGAIFDAVYGGLVIGRSHLAGNIYLVKYQYGLYVTWSNMEGGEYLIRHEAYLQHKAEIDNINSEKDVSSAYFKEMPKGCKMYIVTHKTPEDIYLWIDEKGMFIVNKYSTYKHFDRLQEINTEGIL